MFRRKATPIRAHNEGGMSVHKFMGRRPSSRRKYSLAPAKDATKKPTGDGAVTQESRQPDDESSFFVASAKKEEPTLTKLESKSFFDHFQESIAACIPEKYFEMPVEEDRDDVVVPSTVFIPQLKPIDNEPSVLKSLGPTLTRKPSLKKTKSSLRGNNNKGASSTVQLENKANSEKRRLPGNLSSSLSRISCGATVLNNVNDESLAGTSDAQSSIFKRAGSSFRRSRSEVIVRDKPEMGPSLGTEGTNAPKSVNTKLSERDGCQNDDIEEVSQARLEAIVEAYLAKIKLGENKHKLTSTAIHSPNPDNTVKFESSSPSNGASPTVLNKKEEIAKVRSLPSAYAARRFRSINSKETLYEI